MQLSKFIKETLAHINAIWLRMKEYCLIKRLFLLIVTKHCNEPLPLNELTEKSKGKMR